MPKASPEMTLDEKPNAGVETTIAAQPDRETHFGYETVLASEKASKVRGVFDSVASRYDLMNDAMSLGIHRLWKTSLIDSLAPRAGEYLLDMAGGTGDIAFRAMTAAPGLKVTICDINAEMLQVGQRRAAEKGFTPEGFLCADAENLPLSDAVMDAYTIAFGIRNVTHIDKALSEAFRVLKPGGRFLCLEFSSAVTPLLKPLYDRYSFDIIPKMGKILTGDAASYQYLVESIRRFPLPNDFLGMIKQAGFARARYRSLSMGMVTIHQGWRP